MDTVSGREGLVMCSGGCFDINGWHISFSRSPDKTFDCHGEMGIVGPLLYEGTVALRLSFPGGPTFMGMAETRLPDKSDQPLRCDNSLLFKFTSQVHQIF